MEPPAPFIVAHSCLSRVFPWLSVVHEASCLQQSPPAIASKLFLAFSRFPPSTRVVCSLSRPQVPSYVRRVSLLVRNRLGTVDSLLNFNFPYFSSLLGFFLSPRSSSFEIGRASCRERV